MKILLLGEYSNVHATLAKGLRSFGHIVTVVSNGDFWKNYSRDIDVARQTGKFGGIKLFMRIMRLLPKFRGYDVVQLINPMFFELKAERLFPIYNYLRRHNGMIVLGAYGMDYYWVHQNITGFPLRYSDFNFGNTIRTDDDAVKERKDWIGTPKEKLNKLIANDCDGIVTGLYEYWACYKPLFKDKTTFIPFPLECSNHKFRVSMQTPKTLKLFIGISRNRSKYKGTDVMLAAARALKDKYPGRVDLRIAEGVPFRDYQKMMQGSDAILDQLYSYTPAMNALEAMSRGIIAVGGGEEENYEILGEKILRPIINVQPNYDSVYKELEQLVLHPSRIPILKKQSIDYIFKYHNHLKVARQYINFYQEIKAKSKS